MKNQIVLLFLYHFLQEGSEAERFYRKIRRIFEKIFDLKTPIQEENGLKL